MKTSTSALCLSLFALLGSARAARAKERFPGDIAQHLGASTLPACGICHQDGKTGKDTLVTPFAWTMRARGLSGSNTLIPALDRVAADGVDSDGDGASDVAEIVAGTDPNSAASTPADPGLVGDPKLGCTVGGGAVQRGDAGAVALLAVGGVLAWRRRRR